MATGCSDKEIAPATRLNERIKSYAHGSHWFMFNLWATVSWIILMAASIALFSWPVTVAYLDAKCAEYQAVRVSIELARKNITKNADQHETELRGVQVIIAEWNGWRAFWNKLDQHPIMDFYIPEKIHDLKPME